MIRTGKRLINTRPTVLFSVCFALGIYLSYLYINSVRLPTFIIAPLVITLAVVLFMTKRRALATTVICVLLFLCAGFIVFISDISRLENYQIGRQEVIMTGRVETVISSDVGKANIILCDVTIEHNGELQSLNGKTLVYLRDSEQAFSIDSGDKLQCHCTMSDIYVLRDGVQTYDYKHNLYYEAYYSKDIYVTKGEAGLAVNVRRYIENSIGRYMSPDSGAVAQGLVLGDTSLIDPQYYEAFKRTGTAHVLAVSGLHIGFIVTCISSMLFALRVRHKYRLPIIIIPLFLYSLLVGFSPSVTRAFIMAVVMLAVKYVGWRGDTLTSLSISAFLILLIRPLYLFDAGFLLSVSAVYGIVTLGKYLNCKIINMSLPKFVRAILSSCAICLSATIATIPAMSYFFGEISVIGLLVNLPVVPISSLCFMLTLIALVFPILSIPLMWLADKGLYLISIIVESASSLSIATTEMSSVAIASVLLLIMLFVVFGYINLTKRVRIAVLLTCISLIIPLYIFSARKRAPEEFLQYYASLYGNDHAIAVSTYSQLHYFSYFSSQSDAYNLLQLCDSYDYETVNIYLLDPISVDNEAIALVLDQVDKTYLMQDNVSSRLCETFKTAQVEVPIWYAYGDIVDRVSFDGVIGYKFNFHNFGVLIIDRMWEYIENALPNIDIIVTPNDYTCLTTLYPNAMLFCTTHTEQEGYFNLMKCGNFTITLKGDNILVKP